MTGDVKHVQAEISKAWTSFLRQLPQMSSIASVRPQQASDVFKIQESRRPGDIEFAVEPVVLNVPIKAGQRDMSLYVVAKGWISFDGQLEKNKIATNGFGTEVAYFQSMSAGASVRHVYGAHFDLDETLPGHPVFHAQMKANPDLLQSVTAKFHKPWPEAESGLGRVLSNVRVPTAQMDIFAVLAQICADHLVSESVEQKVQNAFENLRESFGFLREWGGGSTISKTKVRADVTAGITGTVATGR